MDIPMTLMPAKAIQATPAVRAPILRGRSNPPGSSTLVMGKMSKPHSGGRGATADISQTRQCLVKRQMKTRPERTAETLKTAISSVLPGRGEFLEGVFPGTLCRANFRCRSATNSLPLQTEEPTFVSNNVDVFQVYFHEQTNA
jgi:hypothetical protein